MRPRGQEPRRHLSVKTLRPQIYFASALLVGVSDYAWLSGRRLEQDLIRPLESHRLRHCQLSAVTLCLENLCGNHPKDD